jgi:uncharacterized protein YjbI with pentapeptide repeats
MSNENIKTIQDFLNAYKSGQRYFNDLELDEEKGGVGGEILHDAVFENCFMFLDFNGADLANAKFLSCNIKTADFRNANLTNAMIKNCLVESTMFKGAKVDGFIFEENYFHGNPLGQEDFEKYFKDADEYGK